MSLLSIYLFLCLSLLCAKNSMAHPTTSNPVSMEEECLKKNSEYLQVFCTYPGKTHPCFSGTLFYKNRPVHLINIEGVAAYLCSYGTRIEAATSYCCFTEKCLKMCYEEIDHETRAKSQRTL